ncbi:MAG: AAA family ATPase [Alphaproteobacteria bacterium]|nr:AAA family ATPase [Alphaproteobacteria bacterium]
MNLKLKNVGAVKKASVNLTGLSVIAGKNGAGKSTIGKTIYTIIKAVKEKERIIKESRKESAEMLCMRSFFTLQNDIRSRHTKRVVASRLTQDEILLRDYFELNVFARVLLEMISNNHLEIARELVVSRIQMLPNFSDQVSNKTKRMVADFLESLLDELAPKDYTKEIHSALVYMYSKAFNRQINNLVSHNTSEIELEGFIKYTVVNNADIIPFVERFSIDNVNEERQSTIFQNVTLIETPLILQLQKNRDTTNIPSYWSDLIEKVQDGLRTDNILSDSLLRDVYKEVNELLGGRLEFDESQQKLVFVKNDFDKLSNLYVNNMSSGEKMLSILQTFVSSGLLGQEHLLILDEPENHLHPEWQIALANILTKLAGAGYPILINSHSPDFIQALKVFADLDKNISDKTKFYLASTDKGTIVDKTDKVSDILDELSEPINTMFKNLINKNIS